MAYSESLLYAGYQNLSLSQIYMSGIFIGASGAMMDLSVDITSAVNEVIEKKPEISWKEAARSGMNVGRAAMGTMTTTLVIIGISKCARITDVPFIFRKSALRDLPIILFHLSSLKPFQKQNRYKNKPDD